MQQDKETAILAQKNAIDERKLRLRWMIGLSTLPLLTIYAALSLAPQTATSVIPQATIITDLAIPNEALAPIDDNTSLWQSDMVRRDDTLSTLLNRLNIQNQEALDFLRHDSAASALASNLRPSNTILANVNPAGELLSLQYQLDNSNMLTIEKTENGYVAQKVSAEFETRPELKTAEIRTSLFAATDEANIPDAIAMQIADIFSSDIDFHQDLRKGDRLSVVYEANYRNGELVRSGQIQAVEFINQGKKYSAVLFKSEDGTSSYYTPEGKSLHKAFLRTPVEFSRISSGFTLARFHPILQTWRAHKGVDFAAPIGTNVKAVSDATVSFVGQQNGYGNVIMLEHANGISTVYGHLSHFASGLHKGQKVSQGAIIGQVGMSGMATGPHLHYEFRINGVHHDPLTVAMPNAIPLPDRLRSTFIQQSTPFIEKLALLKGTTLVSQK